MTEKRYRIIRELLNARFVKNIVIKKMSKSKIIQHTQCNLNIAVVFYNLQN